LLNRATPLRSVMPPKKTVAVKKEPGDADETQPAAPSGAACCCLPRPAPARAPARDAPSACGADRVRRGGACVCVWPLTCTIAPLRGLVLLVRQ
jgi:hypothetical protein